MRWICLAVIIPVAAATIMFALQNLEIVTMSVLGFIAHLSLALLRPVIRRVETKHDGLVLN